MRNRRTTNFRAAQELIDAMVEIAGLLRGHLGVAVHDPDQSWSFLHARLEVIIRILLQTNRSLINVVDLSAKANILGRNRRRK